MFMGNGKGNTGHGGDGIGNNTGGFPCGAPSASNKVKPTHDAKGNITDRNQREMKTSFVIAR
jgi:hypothetical protein